MVFDEFGDCKGGVGGGADPEVLDVGLRLVVVHIDRFVEMLFAGHAQLRSLGVSQHLPTK